MSRVPLSWMFLLLACGEAREPAFRPAAARTADLAEEESSPPESIDTPELPSDETVPAWRGAPRSHRAVVLAPGDLFTSTSNTSVTIAVPSRGMSEAEVRDLASRFELVTWPDREPIRTEMTYLDEALEHSPFSRIVLRSTVPLESRWYAIRGRLTEDERPAADVAPPDGEGFIVSRFFPDTNPVLRRIVALTRATGGMDIELRFSEPVRLERNTLTVSAGGVDVPGCALGNPTALERTAGSDVVWLTCPAASGDAPLAVHWTAPIFAADGAEARTGEGASLDGLTIGLPARGLARSTGETTEAQIHVPSFGLERGI